MSLVLTFPCATNQVRVLTFEGTFELHKNLAGMNNIGFETFDKVKKKISLKTILTKTKTTLLNLMKKERKVQN